MTEKIISDKAVEVAAKALLETPGDYPGPEREAEWAAYMARSILEAAAPHIAAQALEDAAESIASAGNISKWLLRRAASERGGE